MSSSTDRKKQGRLAQVLIYFNVCCSCRKRQFNRRCRFLGTIGTGVWLDDHHLRELQIDGQHDSKETSSPDLDSEVSSPVTIFTAELRILVQSMVAHSISSRSLASCTHLRLRLCCQTSASGCWHSSNPQNRYRTEFRDLQGCHEREGHEKLLRRRSRRPRRQRRGGIMPCTQPETIQSLLRAPASEEEQIWPETRLFLLE